MKLRHLLVLGCLLVGCVRPYPPPLPAPPAPPIPPAPIVVPVQPAPLRVLIVKDTSKLAELPSLHVAALLSGSVRDYCTSHCRPGPDGKTPEFRSFEWSTDVSKESPELQAMFQEAVTQGKAAGVPYLVVNNGTTGYSGPYPGTEAEVLDILKKYGGT